VLSRPLQPIARGSRLPGSGDRPPKGLGVRKSLPLWFGAVVPSMLVGHAAGYALSGRPLIDARHGWFASALENSSIALIALCAILVACALLYAGFFKHSSIERSLVELWPRLAIAQIVLFAAAESAEGLHLTPAGILTQIATALCAAYLLSLFSRLLLRCIAHTDEAQRYLQRLLEEVAAFVCREPAPRSVTLFASAGHSRFQRPPPFA